MKLIILPLLFLALSIAGCANTIPESKDKSAYTDPEPSFHDRKTQLIVNEDENGITFIYNQEEARDENPPYRITQLPFPTFWGGEAYSVITPEGDLYLIDGGFHGEDGDRIASYIEANGGKVKAWILTHPHVDHIGAFLDYMEENSHKVETVYYSPFTREFFEEEPDPEIYNIINNPNAILFYEFLDMMEATKDHVSYLPMKCFDRLNLGKLKLECFHSFDPDIHDVNGNSLVFTLSYQDFCLLLTGDMTEETLSVIKKKISSEAEFLHPDILQIPHHGYMAGIASTKLYEETSPDYVLLDCTLEEFNNNSVNIQDHIRMIEEMGIKVIKRFEAAEGNKILIYERVGNYSK